MRKYEDESDDANDALKKVEEQLKDKFAAARHANRSPRAKRAAIS